MSTPEKKPTSKAAKTPVTPGVSGTLLEQFEIELIKDNPTLKAAYEEKLLSQITMYNLGLQQQMKAMRDAEAQAVAKVQQDTGMMQAQANAEEQF